MIDTGDGINSASKIKKHENEITIKLTQMVLLLLELLLQLLLLPVFLHLLLQR